MKRVLAFTYGLVSYLLFLGVFLCGIAFWAAPEITLGHLVFALVSTGYIYVAMVLEKRDMIAQFGDQYQASRWLVPWPTWKPPVGKHT